MYEQIGQAAWGAMMGAGYAYWGWKRLGKGEIRSNRKVLRAVLNGAVAGGLAGYAGITLEQAEDLATNGAWSFGIAFGLDQLEAALWKRLKRKEAPA